MKVLHILDSLNPGGAEILELDVCRNAHANGLDLIFAATGGGDLEAEFRTSGTEFIRLQRRLPIDLLLVRQIRKIITANNVKIVHTHQAVEGIHAYLACLGTPAKLVLSFHGYIADAKNRSILRFLIPRTAANVTVSRAFLNWLGVREKLDTTKNFYIVYNGVDQKRLARAEVDLKAELGLPHASLLFGMIGNFYAAPRKDQLTVCRALPDFFRRFPDAHFVFIGEHEEKSDYENCVRFVREQGIGARVSFLGSRSDAANTLRSLDAFVLSSRHDSFGIAAVEAMFAGTPTILSDLEPFLEISENANHSLIFQTGNAKDLTEKMSQLAGDANLRERLPADALKFAVENFSIEEHLANLERLYASLAGR